MLCGLKLLGWTSFHLLCFSDSFQNVAPWDVSSNVSPRRSSSALQVRTRQLSSFPWR